MTNESDQGKPFIELARIAQQSFENRRAYEWKIAFGLWTAIGAITYFVVEHKELISPNDVDSRIEAAENETATNVR